MSTKPSQASQSAEEQRLGNKSMDELLHILEDNTINVPVDWYEVAAMPKPTSLLKRPATAEAIAALEERLETQLPEEYKECLRASDGFENDKSEGAGGWNGRSTEPALFPTERVEWSSEAHFQLPIDFLELPRILSADPDRRRKPGINSDWGIDLVPGIDRVLRIGEQMIDHTLLLHPDTVARVREGYARIYEGTDERGRAIMDRLIDEFAGSREAWERMQWCCVRSTSGSAALDIPFPSFRAYMESLVRRSAVSDKGAWS